MAEKINPELLRLSDKEIENDLKGRNMTLGAAAYSAVISPLAYFAASDAKDAWTFYSQGRHLSELAERNHSISQQAFAKDNYYAAVKHGSYALSYTLLITLPIVLLLRQCRKHFVAAKQARAERKSLEAKL